MLAAVEVDLELGQHLADDRAEFLGQFVLAERRRGFGIDPFEQAREHLFLDPVDRRFETLGLLAALLATGVLTLVEAIERAHVDRAMGGRIGRGIGRRKFFERGELVAALRLADRLRIAAAARAALHRARDAKLRARAASSVAFAESTHVVAIPINPRMKSRW